MAKRKGTTAPTTTIMPHEVGIPLGRVVSLRELGHLWGLNQYRAVLSRLEREGVTFTHYAGWDGFVRSDALAPPPDWEKP